MTARSENRYRKNGLASARSVRNWMVANRGDYQTSTQLAEAAAAQFDFPGDPLSDETHWIWDYAFDVLGDDMG